LKKRLAEAGEATTTAYKRPRTRKLHKWGLAEKGTGFVSMRIFFQCSFRQIADSITHHCCSCLAWLWYISREKRDRVLCIKCCIYMFGCCHEVDGMLDLSIYVFTFPHAYWCVCLCSLHILHFQSSLLSQLYIGSVCVSVQRDFENFDFFLN
jgi:hypothetical protein